MTARAFLDTHVLLYADDLDAGRKQKRARALLETALERGTGVISTQVLQEYFVNATRKLGMEALHARARIEVYMSFEVRTIQPSDVVAAIDLQRTRPLSFWDALVVTCAAESGCRLLLSEDLQHGAVIQGVRIENPFA